MRTATILDIAREHGLELPAHDEETLNPYVKVYDQRTDLQAVLDAFAIAQRSFASPGAVERIAWELFQDAAAQNIKLFELRFSPDWAFSGHSLDWDEAFEGILRAGERAEGELDIVIGNIAITSRTLGPESCDRTVDWAIRQGDRIQGIDLADGERAFPPGLFVEPVRRAREAGLKVTVHTGEDTPASAVVDTIETLEPDRIGHGIHVIDDPAAVELVLDRGIPLEVNPWSNHLTNSVPRIEDHPLKRLFDLGVKTTLNSDDPELLDTNLNNEYRIAHEILGMSLDELARCNRYALECSFIPEAKKRAVGDVYFSR